MTVKELLEYGARILGENGIDNAKNEARWMFEAAFGCGRDYPFFTVPKMRRAKMQTAFSK